MELYAERGFESTTVAEIAERAGLTERTFFRHYADKREVLFGGAAALREFLVARVESAAPRASAFDVVTDAYAAAAAEIFEARRDLSRQRQAIIDRNVELQERELVKLEDLAAAIADALARRGVEPARARLVSRAGSAIFVHAFTEWVATTRGTLADVIAASAEVLREAMGEGAPAGEL